MPPTIITASHFHGSPAKKITNEPAASTSSAVPRSGCLMISPTGTSTISAATTKSSVRRLPSRLWKYHASISGRPSFMISAGWMRPTPMSSQRWAPLTITPLAGGRDQQREPDQINRHREPHQHLRRDIRDDEHDRERDAEVAQLVADPPRKVVAGRVQRDDADHAETADDRDQRRVEHRDVGPDPETDTARSATLVHGMPRCGVPGATATVRGTSSSSGPSSLGAGPAGFLPSR